MKNVTIYPIQAASKLKDDKRAIIASVAVDLPVVTDEANMPADIQWMPPGAHNINASQNGMPVSMGVNVNAEGAANVQKSYELIMDAVAKGEEDRPYFDLNHNDEEASAWPTGFFWAGEDPQNGGIRAKLEWSSAGKAAILGKTYRRFSPSFYCDDNGIVIGAPVNMGGLVNRAAFRKMQPIWSKSSAEDLDPAEQQQQQEEQKPVIMKSLLTVLASQGLLKSADVDEPQAVAQVSAALAERATKDAATQTELTNAKATLDTTKTQLTEARRTAATAVVEAAIQAGRLPAQNEEVKAFWVASIESNPANAKSMPEPNPALLTLVQAKGVKTVVNANQGGEHELIVKAKAIVAEKKISLEGAIAEVAAADGALYDSYRNSLGKAA